MFAWVLASTARVACHRLASAAPVPARYLAVVAYHPPKTDPRLKLADVPAPNERQKQEVPALLARLNLKFNKEDLVFQSLTHVSEGKNFNNSRLSVYGNAILDLTLVEYILMNYPNLLSRSARDMTKFANSTISVQNIAKSIGLDVLVSLKLYPNGQKDVVIADAFRAFVGAVCVDQGLKAAQKLCLDLFIPTVQAIDISTFFHLQHPRLTLTRILAAENRPKPVTTMLNESGRATHLPTFVVGVYSGDILLAQAAGFSIVNAETEACRLALSQHFAEWMKTLVLPQDMDSRDYIPECSVGLMKDVEKVTEKAAP